MDMRDIENKIPDEIKSLLPSEEDTQARLFRVLGKLSPEQMRVAREVIEIAINEFIDLIPPEAQAMVKLIFKI